MYGIMIITRAAYDGWCAGASVPWSRRHNVSEVEVRDSLRHGDR